MSASRQSKKRSAKQAALYDVGVPVPDGARVFVGHLNTPPPPVGYAPPTAFPSWNGVKRAVLDYETYDPDLKAKKGGKKLGSGFLRGNAFACGLGIRLEGESETFAEYYPMRHSYGENCDPEKVESYLRDNLRTFRGEIVGANSNLYDGFIAHLNGVRAPLAKWRDVQWAEPLIDENAPSFALDALCKKYGLELKVKKNLTEAYGKDWIKHFHEVHPGHAREYVLGDLDRPSKIIDMQVQELRKQGLYDLFDMESRLTPLLHYMKKKGVRVDRTAAENFNDELIIRRDAEFSKLSERVKFPVDYDNFQTKKTLIQLFDTLGVKYPFTEPSKNYPNGQPSFTKAWLDGLDMPAARELTAARSFEKSRSTFVEGYILDAMIRGRIHCDFHPCKYKHDTDDSNESGGAETGRFSSSHPNLQNIPTRDPFLGPILRGMFLPNLERWWSIDLCLAPETRVLRSDLTWVPIKDLRLGDELIGCDEDPIAGKSKAHQKHRRLRSAVVEGLKRLRQPCVKICTDKGTVVCSTEHRWLARKGFQTYTWRRAKKLKPGQKIAFTGQPWETDTSRDGGYLAGLFDGEGYTSNGVTAFAQKKKGDNGFVLEEGKRLLLERGFSVVDDDHVSGVHRVRVKGGREATLRLLGSIRSIRLLRKARSIWENRLLRTQTTTPAKILSVEFVGEQDVIALQTNTKTFIAEGLVSHNSQMEYRFLIHFASLARMPGALIARDAYRADPKTDFHQLTANLMQEPLVKVLLATVWGGNLPEDWKKLVRKIAKNINFGLCYGMGVDKLAVSLGLAEWNEEKKKMVATDPAKKIIDTYHLMNPYIKPLNKLATERAGELGYIKTFLQRRRHFDLWEPRGFGSHGIPYPYEEALRIYGDNIRRAETHKALNSVLQGSNADWVKAAMVKIWESGILDENDSNDIDLFITVHDELDGSYIPSARGNEALAEVHNIMQNIYTLEVPVLAECGTGCNWHEAH